MCRSGLLQVSSSPVPAPCRVHPRATPHRPDPVPVAAPLWGGRRLGRRVPPCHDLPLGTHWALWERGRILPRVGFVSPPRNKRSRFPPPQRSRCPRPARSPGTGPPGGSLPLPSARVPATPPPAPGCAPGFQPTLSPGTPVCPQAWKPQVPGGGNEGRPPPRQWRGQELDAAWLRQRGPGPAGRGDPRAEGPGLVGRSSAGGTDGGGKG